LSEVDENAGKTRKSAERRRRVKTLVLDATPSLFAAWKAEQVSLEDATSVSSLPETVQDALVDDGPRAVRERAASLRRKARAPSEGSPLLRPSTAKGDRGELVGRDPRELTPQDFHAAGVPLRPVMKAVRTNCIECCCGQVGEVAKCVRVGCPMWPLRMGVFPKKLRRAANERSA
jgi:hypothetical protein